MFIKKYLMILVCMLVLVTSGCKSTTQDTYEDGETQVATLPIAPDTEATQQPIIEGPLTKSDNLRVADSDGVWYEIFVRSFADGNGDGVGDFVGLTQKLDYLNDGDSTTDTDLGIKGIWLMPINASNSYHGYDVTDYYGVNSDYGTMAEFKTLLEEAHKRGIKVIMDLVINHSSAEHPWFVEAKSDLNSPYRDYYTWIKEDTEGYDVNQMVWGHRVWNKVDDAHYYAIFWDQMPDLNFKNQAVRDEVKKVAQFWLGEGIDGFRMDAVMHIYGAGESEKSVVQKDENARWWVEFDAACREINPECYLLGEVWDELSIRTAYAPMFDSLFDFDVAEASILGMVKNGKESGGDNDGFVHMLTENYTQLRSANPSYIDAPFLTNHDQKRAMNYFAAGDYKSMSLAANILMTLPGNPFIYYGEEIGMLGVKPDERIREPFIWGEGDSVQTSWEALVQNRATLSCKDQLADADSLLSHYKEIIRVRQGQEALLKGDFRAIETTSVSIVAYERYTQNQSVYVIHNLAMETLSFEMSELGETVSELLYASEDFKYSEADLIEIPAQTTLIFGKQ